MKSLKLQLVILIPLLNVLVSCGFPEDDNHTYQSSDKVHMEQLMVLLNRRGIPFESVGGLIQYKGDVKEKFEKALMVFGSATTVEFIDADVKNYFRMLLFNEGIEFIESDNDYGGWTLWWPGSEERKENILAQLGQHKNKIQMLEDTDCESGSNDVLSKPSFIQEALNNRADQQELKN